MGLALDFEFCPRRETAMPFAYPINLFPDNFVVIQIQLFDHQIEKLLHKTPTPVTFILMRTYQTCSSPQIYS